MKVLFKLIMKRGEDRGKTVAPKIGESNRQIQGVLAYQSKNS